MDFYRRAMKLKEETVSHRRYFHRNAESGLVLPRTTEYIWKKLTEYGIVPQQCGHGITAVIGQGSPVILLRADMDALPMQEESGEEFATIAERIPSAMIYLSAGFEDERGDYSAHNPKVRFNEDVCPVGAAAYAHCAVSWLNEHGKKES